MKQNPLVRVISNEAEYNALYGANEDQYLTGDAEANKQFLGKTNSYIFTITNSSGAAIDNVTFLNAAVNAYATNQGLATGITIANGYAGDTYQTILTDILERDMMITGWDFLATTDLQAEATITFTTRAGRGKGSFDTVVPDRDPRNQQTGRTYSDTPVTITKNTTAVLDSLAAGASIRIKMYIGERTAKAGGIQQFAMPTLAVLPGASK